MFKATSVMFISQAITTIILFLRNILVARLISVEDFGIATTFSILFAAIETASNISVNRLVIQHSQGDEVEFQNTMHMVQMVRGVISAVVMILVAYPFANFVKTPDLVWAYQLLAIIPFARGFLHLDIYRIQRHMNFTPFAINLVAAPLFSFLAIGAIYLIWPNYLIMLGAIIAHQLATVILSHVQAERRFGLSWNFPHAKLAISFGGPLLVDGMTMMVVMQGERMFVANMEGLTVLGWYSAAFLLASAPMRILTQTLGSLFLPMLSRRREESEAAFRDTALIAIEAGMLMGIFVAVALAVAGPEVLTAFFGAAYGPGVPVLLLLGMGQAAQVLRNAPNTIAMSHGQTSVVMHTGLVRMAGVAVSYLILAQGYGVEIMATAAFGFEMAAVGLGLWLNRSRAGVPVERVLPGLLAYLAVMGLIGLDMVRFLPEYDGIGSTLHGFQLVLLATLPLSLLTLPRLRGWALARLGRR